MGNRIKGERVMMRRIGYSATAIVLLVAMGAGGAKLRAVDNSVTTFAVTLGAAGVPGATDYQLTAVDEGKRKTYSLRVSRRLTGDFGWTSGFQTGQIFDKAIVQVLDSTLNPVNSYILSNATISSVRQTGLASNPFVIEEITLISGSLSVTP
jgi:hypothetical protein